MSPVILGFGALDAMIAAQALYAARDLNRKGDDHVCMRCWHIWPVAHPTPSATPAHTDKEA